MNKNLQFSFFVRHTVILFYIFTQSCVHNHGAEMSEQEVKGFGEAARVEEAIRELSRIERTSQEKRRQGVEYDSEVVAALNIVGSKRDYFSMDDFVDVLKEYERIHGRDILFLSAARLAYSYSDGE